MKIGPFSRGGMARGQAAVHAADHDMQPLTEGIAEYKRMGQKPQSDRTLDRLFGKPGHSRLFEAEPESIPRIGEDWFGRGDNLFGDEPRAVVDSDPYAAAARSVMQAGAAMQEREAARRQATQQAALHRGRLFDEAAVPEKRDRAMDSLFAG